MTLAASPSARLLRGLTWEGLSDGQVWRLKRGKHYAGDTRALAQEAGAAAERIGKAVRTLRDDFGAWQYLWVQFADAELPLGAPCPSCGSREIVRTHEHFGRCPACATTFVFRGDVTGAAARAPSRRRGARHHLGEFEDLVLRYDRHADQSEWWYGSGTNDLGMRVLLIVRYLVDHAGERLEDPDRPGEPLTLVRAFPIDPFREAIDLDVLAAWGRADDPPVAPEDEL